MDSLLIDDNRDPKEYRCDEVARDYVAGIGCLSSKTWNHLYLDMDLGPGKSGMDVIMWLKGNPAHRPGHITLVTSTIIILDMLACLLEHAGYKRMSDRVYILNIDLV